jgi:hypothetical protein
LTPNSAAEANELPAASDRFQSWALALQLQTQQRWIDMAPLRRLQLARLFQCAATGLRLTVLVFTALNDLMEGVAAEDGLASDQRGRTLPLPAPALQKTEL